jgi:hypothetical protein
VLFCDLSGEILHVPGGHDELHLGAAAQLCGRGLAPLGREKQLVGACRRALGSGQCALGESQVGRSVDHGVARLREVVSQLGEDLGPRGRRRFVLIGEGWRRRAEHQTQAQQSREKAAGPAPLHVNPSPFVAGPSSGPYGEASAFQGPDLTPGATLSRRGPLRRRLLRRPYCGGVWSGGRSNLVALVRAGGVGKAGARLFDGVDASQDAVEPADLQQPAQPVIR